MASMVFASSPLSAQSFVKLTNSNYSHPSCYIPRVKNSYVQLSYKNVSHIESSKSLFTKGDGNLSFSSQKFPRVASTYSPSLNIIKACSRKENVYHYTAYDLKKGNIQLKDDYEGMILLIVNIPQQRSKWTKGQIEFLNDLREHYKGKTSSFGRGFEVLGFFHDMEELDSKELESEKKNEEIPEFPPGEEEILMGEKEVRELANFPLFRKVSINNDHESFWRRNFAPNLIEKEINKDLWYFLRRTCKVDKIKQAYEKFLVGGEGNPLEHFIRFDGETLKSQTVRPGESPGEFGSKTRIINPTSPIKVAIDKFHWRDNPRY